MTPTSSVPMPGEIHPAYADQPELITWLEGDRYPEIRLPRSRTRAATFRDPELRSSIEAAPPPHVMRRRKCLGLAPYVGRPFAYVWRVGEDELGRCIAGDARIQYLEDFYE